MALDLSKSFLEKNRKGRLKEIESALKRKFGLSNEDPYPPEREEITLPQPVEPVEKLLTEKKAIEKIKDFSMQTVPKSEKLLTEKKAIEKIKDFSMQTVPKRNDMFNHAGQFSQGVSTKGERIGSGIIVSQDGTGDFDNLQEAINSLDTNTGGMIFLKNGTYIFKQGQQLNFENFKNISIIGDGWGTIIRMNNYTVDLKNSSNITLRNLKIERTSAVGGVDQIIRMDSASSPTFDNIWIYSDISIDYVFGSLTKLGPVGNWRMTNCLLTVKGGESINLSVIKTPAENAIFLNNNFPNFPLVTSISDWDKTLIIGNIFGKIDATINDSLIKGNIILSDIELTGGTDSCSKNIVIGNQCVNIIIGAGFGGAGKDEWNVVMGNICSGTITTVLTYGVNNTIIGNMTETAIANNGGVTNDVNHNKEF